MFSGATPLSRETRKPTTAVPGRPRGRGVVLLAGLLAGAVPGRAEAQFSVQPVIVEMRVADSARAASFAVRNESDEAMRLRIYGADFDQPDDGSHQFMALGAHPRSCAGRLQVSTDLLVIPPEGQAEVQVRLAAGDSTCWSMVFVQSQSSEPGGIRIAQRIGVKVYGVGSRGAPAGEIRNVAVVGAGPDRRVEITFGNTGQSPLRPEGEMEVRTLEGDIVAVVPVPAFSVLPGRSRRATVPFDVTLGPGRYLVIPILDFGADYLAGGQGTFEVDG